MILDLEMPKMSGVEAARIIKLKFPQTKILILSGFENEKYVTQILKSGAGGYVVKNVGKDELADAIRIVAEGKRFFSPSVSRIMVEGLLKKHSAELEKLSHIREPLTDLEMEILSFLTQGLKPEQIGERLSMSKVIRRQTFHRSEEKTRYLRYRKPRPVREGLRFHHQQGIMRHHGCFTAVQSAVALSVGQPDFFAEEP